MSATDADAAALDGKQLTTTEPAAAGGEKLPSLRHGFSQLPKGRQISLIVTLATALALALAVTLWSQRVERERLFSSMPDKEAGEIVEALKKMNVDYKLDGGGSIMVPTDQVHELRLKLASQGMLKDGGFGFEILDGQSSIGSSQLLEGARHQRAMEGELARSIMTLHGVKSARVHLAIPKESVFIRNPRKPSASVIIELSSGRGLDPGQVEGIAHLVAAGIPQLEPNQVTVVDHRGQLLNSADAAHGMNLTTKQFDYKKLVEDHLIDRVDNILSPVVGRDGLRTQVSADVDFTVTERTQEIYNPDLPALRSEQTREEQLRNQALAQGIPGALTNQPPPAGTAPEVAPGQPANPRAGGAGGAAGGQTGTAAAPDTLNQSKSATRNYELDKTISHSQQSPGEIRRLTVAVVVDHQRIAGPDGKRLSQPWSDEDLGRFTNLVKEAVGFDPSRGDRVTVTNAAFQPELELPPVPIWETPLFWNAVKYAGTGLVILLIIFGVIRPIIHGLLGQSEAERRAAEAIAAAQAAAAGGVAGGGGEGDELRELRPGGRISDDERMAVAQGDEVFLLEAPQSYEKRLEFAQRAIDQDPKRVAQVIKTWMGTNNG